MIKIDNLHFSYGKKPVFTGLSLELKAGHIYGLLGKNGTGKSTLLRNMNGLLFPKQGKVEVLGFEPRHRQPSFLQKVFLVPEEFELPATLVIDFVRTTARFYPHFNQVQFDAYLNEFEIPVSNKLTEMSYGQKKKVLIAFGLACNTEVLLMDEPTNGLDIMSKSQFRKVMAKAMDEQKCIIISTHQVKDLESLIDRITIIDEGSILFDKSIDEVTEKLHFKIATDDMEIQQAIYSEPSLKGSAIIVPNAVAAESKLDLELLYKAIVTNRAAVMSAFTNQ
jgi:ABC-2 type transport system ATP-binding protein